MGGRDKRGRGREKEREGASQERDGDMGIATEQKGPMNRAGEGETKVDKDDGMKEREATTYTTPRGMVGKIGRSRGRQPRGATRRGGSMLRRVHTHTHTHTYTHTIYSVNATRDGRWKIGSEQSELWEKAREEDSSRRNESKRNRRRSLRTRGRNPGVYVSGERAGYALSCEAEGSSGSERERN